MDPPNSTTTVDRTINSYTGDKNLALVKGGTRPTLSPSERRASRRAEIAKTRDDWRASNAISALFKATGRRKTKDREEEDGIAQEIMALLETIDQADNAFVVKTLLCGLFESVLKKVEDVDKLKGMAVELGVVGGVVGGMEEE